MDAWSADAPSASCTTATTSEPQRSEGRPVTTTSATAGWPGDGALDLLDEDLLAARVHRHRVAAEQLDLAVGQVAAPGRRGWSSGRRRSPGRCAPSCPASPRYPSGTFPVWASHPLPSCPGASTCGRAPRRRRRCPGPGRNVPTADVVDGGDVHLRPGLRRAGRVGDDEVGEPLERHGPHGRGQRRAAVAHGEERRRGRSASCRAAAAAAAARRRRRWSWSSPSRARRWTTRRRGRRGGSRRGRRASPPGP